MAAGRGRKNPKAAGGATVSLGAWRRSVCHTVPSGKAQHLRCADMKQPRHLQGGVGAKEHPTGVEQKHIGPGNVGLDQAVNVRALPPGHPTQDVLDALGIGGGEAGSVIGADIEAVKAVKQIRAVLGPCPTRDGMEPRPCWGHLVPRVPSEVSTVFTCA